MSEIVEKAKRIFDKEIDALEKMKESLDNTFETIVREIVNCEGKLIITGIGKPGHIAEKLASTFASLGTPSFYLHPGEAMHGDLGMISSNDIVFAISYSGESEEIINILPNIRMIGAKIIALTANRNSSLAKAADIVQVLPEIKEACYLQLAPTSSTTVELCYGDTLAIIASEIHGFNSSDFGKFHPAGSLGKKLIIKVNDLMVKEDGLPCVHVGTYLEKAISVMTEKRLGIVTIIDDKCNLIGIMTDADLRQVIANHKDIYETIVDEVMNKAPKTFLENRLAVDALNYMRENSVNVLPIIEEKGTLVGVLHVQQIIKAGIVI